MTNGRRTNVPGIWAVGECNRKGAFTHTSYDDYEIVAANLLDNDPRKVSDRIMTYGLLTDPPLGRAAQGSCCHSIDGARRARGELKTSITEFCRLSMPLTISTYRRLQEAWGSWVLVLCCSPFSIDGVAPGGLKASGDLVSSWITGVSPGFRFKHRSRSNFLTYHEAAIENSYP